MSKASSMFACRHGRRRRRLHLERATASTTCAQAITVYHFPARGISRRRNAQRSLTIPSSAASVCEQAFCRELLLPLIRDTVLAAVPWLRSSAQARH
jgi:hypothetical protein